jgi:hypothetical protein
MTTWKEAAHNALVSGSAASVASTAALLACGEAEIGRPLAPVNAISHWFWGDRAARKDHFSPQHTISGYLTHHGASLFWATIYEKLFGERRRLRPGVREFGDAALISALACFVDYQMTPRRLTPGFEKRLSRTSLAIVYGAFAVGLAVGGTIEALAGNKAGRENSGDRRQGERDGHHLDRCGES